MQLSKINGVNRSCRLQRCFRLAGYLVASVMVVAIAYPQGRGADSPSAIGKPGQPPNKDKSEAGEKRRLETITWNPTTCELTWVVSEGNSSSGAYLPLAQATYRIHIDAAVMEFNGEGRRFSRDEAQNVHILMDLLSRYAIESTIWWELDQGEKLDEQKSPSAPGEKNNTPLDLANLRRRLVRVGRSAEPLIELNRTPSQYRSTAGLSLQ